LAQLKDLLKKTLKEAPEMTVLKIDNRTRGPFFDQQRHLAEMEKAIKGEKPGKLTEDQNELGTHMTVYFALTDFTRESILALMNTLAEKEIAFEKTAKREFDFFSEFSMGKSAIYFGVLNSDKLLCILSRDAYRKAGA
jgi:hypothetical protein